MPDIGQIWPRVTSEVPDWWQNNVWGRLNDIDGLGDGNMPGFKSALEMVDERLDVIEAGGNSLDVSLADWWRGEWAAETHYSNGDIVSKDGSLWVSLADDNNLVPGAAPVTVEVGQATNVGSASSLNSGINAVFYQPFTVSTDRWVTHITWQNNVGPSGTVLSIRNAANQVLVTYDSGGSYTTVEMSAPVHLEAGTTYYLGVYTHYGYGSLTPSGIVDSLPAPMRKATIDGAMQTEYVGFTLSGDSEVGWVKFLESATGPEGPQGPPGDAGSGGVATNGNQSTAVGLETLAADPNTAYNTALGYRALKSATSGSANTAVGRNAQTALTTGYNNSALGLQAQSALTTGFQNTGVGGNAQSDLTSGSRNTAVGDGAGGGVTVGEGNTSIGFNAQRWLGSYAAHPGTSYQTCVGMESGQIYPQQQSNHMTVIGYRATGVQNATAIGAGAGAEGNGSVAIGRDSSSNGASALLENEIALGTSNHTTRIAGWLQLNRAQATVGPAGAASPLPATPTKYLIVKDSTGTEYVVPAYAKA